MWKVVSNNHDLGCEVCHGTAKTLVEALELRIRLELKDNKTEYRVKSIGK